MLDSGSTVSLLRQDCLNGMEGTQTIPSLPMLQLVTATGTSIPIVDYIEATVKIGNKEVRHKFIVVDSLITSAILGIDFMKKHRITLDFNTTPVGVFFNDPNSDSEVEIPSEVQQMWSAGQVEKSKAWTAALLEPATDTVDECSIPLFNRSVEYDLPESREQSIRELIQEYRDLFPTTPGKTNKAQHFIATSGTPARVPPRRVPVHYRQEVETQIQHMLDQGIIEECSSPWMAPAVFVKKKTGDLRICVDYRELNKRTTKDVYPLPLPDEVQNRLAGAKVFSTLDMRSGYWQVPINPEDRPKTAFCPGPDMGLFQFTRMPFGLTGAPSTFQRMMNKILRGLPFVTVYIDDVLVHSASIEEHRQHLKVVFQHLRESGLTMKGSKCSIAVPEVHYLGHVFSADGMKPDPRKTEAISEWPIPTSVKEVRQFVGLASYYRRYIQCFAEISKPLHVLTQKNVPFVWSEECNVAFNELKTQLIQAPVLTYPRFDYGASQFVLQTDASAYGIGAVLEQDGHVVAYISRALSKAEQQYSVIQKECLGAVYAMKQLRHYLLGRPFKLVTDHKPLQWLSAQKMEGLLCRWALSLQEFEFTIEYRCGDQNANADSLSRRVSQSTLQSAATQISNSEATQELRDAQLQDTTLGVLIKAVGKSSKAPPKRGIWKQPPLSRYHQLWSQLCIQNGVLCRTYAPDPATGPITVPVVPNALQQQALQSSHDSPSAGHQGVEKTLFKLRQVAYWVNMASDVSKYCLACARCQQSKLPAPVRAPLQSIPIGRPWQMIAIDILEVPLSLHDNRYLLVIQDYFTKWAEAIPLKNQTASTITTELIKVFATYGIPQTVHSDQGRNFESTLLRQTLEAFGVNKSRTTAYHPQGDGMVERFNRSLLQLLRSYVHEESDWERFLPLVLYAYRTTKQISTGVSPFNLLFGRTPAPLAIACDVAYDPVSYQGYLVTKMATIQDFVEANLVEAASQQQVYYNRHSCQRQFKVGDPVWLSVPTAGKLDPKWEGGWTVTKVESPVTIQIQKANKTRVVHVNRLQHRIQPPTHHATSNPETTTEGWW